MYWTLIEAATRSLAEAIHRRRSPPDSELVIKMPAPGSEHVKSDRGRASAAGSPAAVDGDARDQARAAQRAPPRSCVSFVRLVQPMT